MNNNFLSFSSGCVINFDDIGEYPDYHEVIINLRADIKVGKINKKSITTFVDSQLDDVQHVPECSELFVELANSYHLLQEFTNKEKGLSIKQKFVILLLKVIKSYFICYSLDDDKVQPLIQLVRKEYNILSQEYLVDFFFSIAEMAAYAERHNELIPFILSMLNERQIFEDQNLSMLYLKGIDKIFRFAIFRDKITGEAMDEGDDKMKEQERKIIEETVDRLNFIKFKEAQYKNGRSQEKEQLKEAFKSFESEVMKNQKTKESNAFLQNYLNFWRVKLG